MSSTNEAPVGTAGDGPVERMAHTYPAAFYEKLVALGGDVLGDP